MAARESSYNWKERSLSDTKPKSDLLELIHILVVTFGEETPVYSREQATNHKPPPAYPAQTMPYPLPGEKLAPSCPRSMSSDADQTTGSDSSTIEDENQELQKLQGLLRCKICKVRRVALTFQPCGHCIACMECGYKVQVCPICPKSGNSIRGTVKTIFAS